MKNKKPIDKIYGFKHKLEVMYIWILKTFSNIILVRYSPISFNLFTLFRSFKFSITLKTMSGIKEATIAAIIQNQTLAWENISKFIQYKFWWSVNDVRNFGLLEISKNLI